MKGRAARREPQGRTTGPPQGRKVYTVTELGGEIIKRLETGFPEVWVRGEVSDFVRHSSGHWYFTLKDEKSVLRAVMFRFQNSLLRFVPEEGMEVILRGQVTGYAARSSYQLRVETIEPLGRGALFLEFERLKERLAREGLFDPERKRKIPSPLKRAALITSLAGAALQDMLRVLRERDPGIELLIIPARVQGEGAAESLVHALELANRHEVARPPGRRPLEAVIIGRGGGSLEDLWAFNHERLARAIASSALPVISAVGHEIDFTIADFAADLRAPTPTAAAEIIAAGRTERIQKLAHRRERMTSALDRLLEQARSRLQEIQARLADPRRELNQLFQRLDEMIDRGERALLSRLELADSRLEALTGAIHSRDPRQVNRSLAERLQTLSFRLGRAVGAELERGVSREAQARARLTALSPRGALRRGFSIVRDREGKVVREAKTVKPGDGLEVILFRGRLMTSVDRVDNEEGEESGPSDP